MKHTGIIYQAYNNISKKSYIGQTIHTLAHRKYYHFYDARRKGKKKNHFQSALLKYDIEDWTWSIVEQNIAKKDLDSREMYYIQKFDSYLNGYNSTIGGGGLNGSAKSYKLYHEDHGWREMTMQEFSDTYGVNKGAIAQVIKGNRTHNKGWCLSIEARDCPRNKNKINIQLKRTRKSDKHIMEIYGITYQGTYKEIAELSGGNIITIRGCRTREERRTKDKKFSREDLQKIKYIETIRINNKNNYK